MKVKGVENAILELDKALKRSTKAKARKTEADRGDFTSARYGFSFGGGQGVRGFLPTAVRADTPASYRYPSHASSRMMNVGPGGSSCPTPTFRR